MDTSHKFKTRDYVRTKDGVYGIIDSTCTMDGGQTWSYGIFDGKCWRNYLGHELTLYTEHQQAVDYLGEDYFA